MKSNALICLIITTLCAARCLSEVPASKPVSKPATTSTTQPRKLLKVTGKIGNGADDVVTIFVDVNDAPDARDWGMKAAKYAIEVYPKIAAALPSDGYVPAREVTLYFKVMTGAPAFTAGRKITINWQYVKGHLDDWGMVAHELTHVIQHYGRGNKDAGWLTEGIADYVRYYVIEPGTRQGRFNPDRATYKGGYQPAAGMLNWLEKTKGPGFVVKLNDRMRSGRYTPELFKEMAGGDPDEMWEKFKESLKQAKAETK